MLTEPAAEPAAEEKKDAPSEPSGRPRVVTSERRVRSAPPLEATEEAEATLVPRAQRRKRVKAKGLQNQFSRKNRSNPEPVRKLAEVRELLEEPQPVVLEEIAQAAAAAEQELEVEKAPEANETQEEQAVPEEADYDVYEEQFQHVDARSDWGGSIVTEASYEICEIPDLYAAKKAALEAKEATQKLQARRLQAPPLYAAGVAGSSAQSSAGPTPLESELSKALELCEQIQGFEPTTSDTSGGDSGRTSFSGT